MNAANLRRKPLVRPAATCRLPLHADASQVVGIVAGLRFGLPVIPNFATLSYFCDWEDDAERLHVFQSASGWSVSDRLFGKWLRGEYD